jgi:hypothetical protein
LPAELIPIFSSISTWQYLIAFVALLVGGFAIVSVAMVSLMGVARGSVGLTELMVMVITLGVSAVFYLVPGFLLWRAAVLAKKYSRDPNQQLLIQSLQSQRGFWRLLGIFLVCGIGIYLLVLFVGLLGVAFLR